MPVSLKLRRLVMIMAGIVVYLLLFVGGCQAAQAQSVVSDEFLDAIALVESGGGRNARGAQGEVGAYQFSRAAWTDVSRLRRAQGSAVVSHAEGATHPQWARAYARDFLRHLEQRLGKALGRSATVGEVYAAYNLGWSAFKRRSFVMAATPKITRDAVRRIYNLMDKS